MIMGTFSFFASFGEGVEKAFGDGIGKMAGIFGK
jgi:hypothetical protein